MFQSENEKGFHCQIHLKLTDLGQNAELHLDELAFWEGRLHYPDADNSFLKFRLKIALLSIALDGARIEMGTGDLLKGDLNLDHTVERTRSQNTELNFGARLSGIVSGDISTGGKKIEGEQRKEQVRQTKVERKFLKNKREAVWRFDNGGVPFVGALCNKVLANINIDNKNTLLASYKITTEIGGVHITQPPAHLPKPERFKGLFSRGMEVFVKRECEIEQYRRVVVGIVNRGEEEKADER